MLGKFFNKPQSQDTNKTILLSLIQKLDISDEQKSLYIGAVETLPSDSLKDLYLKINKFIEELEIKNLGDIEKYQKHYFIGKTKLQAQKQIIERNGANLLFHNM